jgi:hypothetical protein
MENRLKYIEGETYILDKNFRNHSEVKLVKIYGEHFCRVEVIKYPGQQLDVRIKRLTFKPKENECNL